MHVPKTAGVSMLSFCEQHRIRLLGHDTRDPHFMSLAEYKQKHDPNCFAFAFVRNPWARAVSSFFYLQGGGQNAGDREDSQRYIQPYGRDFKGFVEFELMQRKDVLEQMHFRPQVDWLSDRNGQLVIDFVGQTETLQADLDQLCQLFGFSKHNLSHLNKSQHRDYREYYDDQTRKIVGQIYQQDVRLFGYRFGG